MKIFKIDKISNDIEFTQNINYIIHKILNEKLLKSKKLIDKNPDLWEKYKKQSNIYEYIYISNNNQLNICKINPISRSYFKLYELIYDLKLLDDINNINIACIAEGPGGFIQSLLHNCGNKNININKLYAISLLSNNKKIPSWNKLITNNKNISILSGIKKNGDICDVDNIKSFINHIGDNLCDIVTCDGGIDYSENFNKQELISYDFIFYEILLSLHILKNNGTYIIKLFDILNLNTVKILYILNLSFEEVYITKPYTSRFTNSEKYIVCKKYKKNDILLKHLRQNCYTKNILLKIPNDFIEIINKYNNFYVNEQINNIETIINLINNKSSILNKPTELQTNTAIDWCKKYNISY